MFLILSCFRQYWPAQLNARAGKFKQGLKRELAMPSLRLVGRRERPMQQPLTMPHHSLSVEHPTAAHDPENKILGIIGSE